MCGCNKQVKPKGYITQPTTFVKKMWEKTQLAEKPITVKQINKP
jgi:hypothetical protein